MSRDASRPAALLFVVGWFPNSIDPAEGTFIREHALAASMRMPVVVLHLRLAKGSGLRTSVALEQDGPLLIARIDVRTPLRRFGLHDLLVRRAYRSALRLIESRFRVATAHIHVLLPSTSPMIDIARERGWPVLITEHSSFYHRGASTMPQAIYQERRREAIARLNDPIVARILPVSNDLGNRMVADFGVDPDKLLVVPNAASAVFKPGFPPPVPPVRILLAARWTGPKDPDLFIDALLKLTTAERRELWIDWVGDGDQLPAIQQRCQAIADLGRLQFHGLQQKSAIAELLANAHVLVHPSKTENAPCIIMEAHCCGTPVISNAINGVPEMVDDTNGILCPAGDLDAIVAALRTVIRDPERFNRALIATNAERRYSLSAVGAMIVQANLEAVRPR